MIFTNLADDQAIHNTAPAFSIMIFKPQLREH